MRRLDWSFPVSCLILLMCGLVVVVKARNEPPAFWIKIAVALGAAVLWELLVRRLSR